MKISRRGGRRRRGGSGGGGRLASGEEIRSENGAVPGRVGFSPGGTAEEPVARSGEPVRRPRAAVLPLDAPPAVRGA